MKELDAKIVAAALRWHTARAQRLEVGAEKRRHQQAEKQRTGAAIASCDMGRRLTAARRLELIAARELFSLCSKVRDGQSQVESANVIDLPVLLICDESAGGSLCTS